MRVECDVEAGIQANDNPLAVLVVVHGYSGRYIAPPPGTAVDSGGELVV
jgi:hypothetical protein